jgi:hypothetical protein
MLKNVPVTKPSREPRRMAGQEPVEGPWRRSRPTQGYSASKEEEEEEEGVDGHSTLQYSGDDISA